MLGAGFSFALLAACVKLLAEHNVPTGQIVFFRAFVALAVLFVFMRWRGLAIATPLWKKQLSNNVVGIIALVAYFSSIKLLPLTTAVTLNYASPIFVGLLLMLGKHLPVGPGQIVALLAGFAGVALLLNPSFDSSAWLGYFIAVTSAVLSAKFFLNIRQLGSLGEPSVRSVFYFNLFSSIAMLPWYLMSDPLRAMDISNAALLFAIGLLSVLGQVMLTFAYQQGKPLLSASLGYSQVAFSFLLGVWIWHDSLSIYAVFGMLLIACSGIMTSAMTKK